MISLENKVSLITGASRGIGRATALLFARAGSDVIINYRSDEDAADSIKDECRHLGVRAMTIGADVANRSEVDTMVQTAIEAFGRIDILVNNAGVWEENRIDAIDETRLKRAIDINLYGTFYPTMAVVPHMKRQRSGSIINVSSTAGQRGEAFHSPLLGYQERRHRFDQIVGARTGRVWYSGQLRRARLSRYRYVPRRSDRRRQRRNPPQDTDGSRRDS